jgi:uncharacterized NAD(P)/FAD-binding protein YdhS
LGPLVKGVFCATTAVPEIRVQCERFAVHMLASTGIGPPARQAAESLA